MTELKRGMLEYNPAYEGLAFRIPGVTFSNAGGVELKMDLLVPMAVRLNKEHRRRYPCIVFVQGCGWMFPDVNKQLAQLAEFARAGYVVASVTHRSVMDGHKAPAAVVDVKTAIRFLRHSSETYGIDPQRIAIWGSSSGGCISLVAALTAEDPAYRTEEYQNQSDHVCCAIDCYGPAVFDVHVRRKWEEMAQAKETSPEPDRFTRLLGTEPEEIEARIRTINPYGMLEKGRAYPPILLIHGTADKTVAYDQSEMMAQKLCQYDVDTELVTVPGAGHGGSFWSKAVYDKAAQFLKDNL